MKVLLFSLVVMIGSLPALSITEEQASAKLVKYVSGASSAADFCAKNKNVRASSGEVCGINSKIDKYIIAVCGGLEGFTPSQHSKCYDRLLAKDKESARVGCNVVIEAAGVANKKALQTLLCKDSSVSRGCCN